MADERTDTYPANPTEHWCEQEGCKHWGSLGIEDSKKVTHWFCFEHPLLDYVPRFTNRA